MLLGAFRHEALPTRNGPSGALRPSGRVLAALLAAALALVAGSASSPARAQRPPARVDAAVLADSVKVGERFRIALVAEHAADSDVLFPDPAAGAAVFGDLEVVRRGRVHRRSLPDPGRQIDSVAYVVRTFALDSVRVPPLPVGFATAGDTAQVRARARTVPVVSVVGPDAQGPQDLAPLASFPQPLWPWVLLGLAVLAAAAGLAYWWWGGAAEEKPAGTAAEPPERPPHEVARDRMDALQEHDLTAPDAAGPYYVELSDVIRTYLARRLGVRAKERTTTEVVRILRKRDAVSETAVERIRAVLEVCDLVKFADAHPSVDDGERALRQTRAALEDIEARAVPRVGADAPDGAPDNASDDAPGGAPDGAPEDAPGDTAPEAARPS